MKEMIRPYNAIPSAMATKIRDLPKIEPSSLIAPSAAPVSYTHLDVYKRQVYREGEGRELADSGKFQVFISRGILFLMMDVSNN